MSAGPPLLELPEEEAAHLICLNALAAHEGVSSGDQA